MMKKLQIPLLLMILTLGISCNKSETLPGPMDDVNILNSQRAENIALLCANTSKTWAISEAILNTASTQFDITENYNIKDDEFIFNRSGETGNFVWKKRYDINMEATNIQETLFQKYKSSYTSNFYFADESATKILSDSSELSFTINDDGSVSVSFTSGSTSLELQLVKKVASMLTEPPVTLNFSDAFTIETDLIGAVGMTGSYADNSLLISMREDRFTANGQIPERIIKVNLDDNSLSDHLYFQSGFASRQCIIENDKVLIVGGTRINIYDRLQLDNDPISMDFPIYPAYSRFGTALQEDQVFLIGGALGNNEEAINNRKKILKFDLNTQSFSDFAVLPEPKSGARGAIVDNHLYVFGGSENLYGNTPTKKIYKIELDSGFIDGDLDMHTNMDFTYVQQVEHLIYVAGSIIERDASGNTIGREATIGVLNTMTNVFEEIPTNLNNASGLETIHQMCIVNNKMYLIYGDEDTSTGSADIDEWNILVAELD